MSTINLRMMRTDSFVERYPYPKIRTVPPNNHTASPVPSKGAFSEPKEVNHLTLNAFESGIYFIEIKTEEKVWLKKFIVE